MKCQYFYSSGMLKKFLVVMIYAIICNIYAMEEPSLLCNLMTMLPENNSVACFLDIESFSALTCVCQLSQVHCDCIHTKYLAIDFLDAAEHGSKNLIYRFLKETVLFGEPDISDVMVWQGEKRSSNIQILHTLMHTKFQRYFGDYKLRYISDKGTVVRYLFGWNDKEYVPSTSYHKSSCIMYINNKACTDVVNNISGKWFVRFYGFYANALIFNSEVSYGGYCVGRGFLNAAGAGIHCKTRDYALSANLYTTENLLKKFGEHILLRVALEQNHSAVVFVLLKTLQKLDLLSVELFNQIMQGNFYNQEIKNIIGLFNHATSCI
jgi:hypothetical protein